MTGELEKVCKEVITEMKLDLAKHIATTKDIKERFSYSGAMREVVEAQAKARWIRVEEIEKWIGTLEV